MTPLDLTGQRYGRLSVRGRAPNRGRRVRWYCDCTCGAQTTVVADQLRSSRTRSCGCLQREELRERRFRHGQARPPARTPEYRAWCQMKTRCTNPNCDKFQYYGGRGITICPQWIDSFEAFFADVGRKPNPRLTLDRINNEGNYEPGNVRWATAKQQAANQRRTAVERSAQSVRNLHIRWHVRRGLVAENCRYCGQESGPSPIAATAR